MSPATIHRDDCGVCSDCLEDTGGLPDMSLFTHGLHLRPSHTGSRSDMGPMVVHCIEASEVHHGHLAELKAAFPFQSQSAEWKLHHAAASNVSGSVRFSAGCGTELCSIQAGGTGQAVRAVSVSDFVEQEGIEHVDILKIDTEGFDPAVIQGAMKVLREGRVSVLYFEYHELRLWQSASLKDIVAELASTGFACYLDGQPTLARLDAGCWDEAYEVKAWSNVVCVSQHLTNIFGPLSG